MSSRNIVVITGLSGSGKSTAAKTFEDIGFFCIDNLPVDLVPKLIELVESGGSELNRLALVIDLRQRKFFPRYAAILNSLELHDTSFEILFLEARDEVLIRRYSETRRQHPLAPTGSLIDGITREREELEQIKRIADRVINTSDITVHQLRDEIRKIYSQPKTDSLKIVINSFGFGKGLPLESDMVLDVRFLPNPHFVDSLRPQTGMGEDVRKWVLSKETTKKFLTRLQDLLEFLLPLYISEGKQYFTLSIGCTGGRHRSVVIAEYISKRLWSRGYRGVQVRHREIGIRSSPEPRQDT